MIQGKSDHLLFGPGESLLLSFVCWSLCGFIFHSLMYLLLGSTERSSFGAFFFVLWPSLPVIIFFL
jgi:hypothetical protein